MDFLGADNVPGPTNPDANYVGGLVKCKFDLKRASQLFDQLDVDRGGTLDEKELEGLLGQMGYQTNPVEVAKMMCECHHTVVPSAACLACAVCEP